MQISTLVQRFILIFLVDIYFHVNCLFTFCEFDTVAFLIITTVVIRRIIRRRLLDGHAGSAIKVLVAIHYSVLDARNGYIRNVVV